MIYKPSGKAPFLPMLGILIIAPFFACLAAYAYVFLQYWITMVLVWSLLPFGYGGLALILTNHGVKRGKIRNPLVAGLIGAVVGIIFLWVLWAMWLDYRFFQDSQDFFLLLFSPLETLQIITEVNAIGTWTLKHSDAVSGWFLGIFWFVEAAIVLVMPCTAASTAETPFSETENEWCKPEILPIPFAYIDNPNSVIPSILENPENLLTLPLHQSITLPLEHKDSLNFAQIGFYVSPQGKDCYLFLNNKIAKQTEKETHYTPISLIRNLQISPTLLTQLRGLEQAQNDSNPV
jgi:hypothetical protein